MALYAQISNWSFRGDRSVVENMHLAKEAGFAGIELTIGEHGDLTADTPRHECHNLALAAKAMKLKIGSVACGLLWGANSASAKKATRDLAVEITCKSLRVTANLGAAHLLVLPGHVGVPWEPKAEVVPYDDCYQRSLAFCKTIAKTAAKCGVVACMENVWNRFLLSPLEFRQFLKDVGSKYVQMYFDVGNVWNTGYPQHWIKIMGKAIQRVHVKDFQRAVGTLEGFCQLGEGDVPLRESIKLLKKAGYKGPVTAEVFPGRDASDEEGFLKTTADRLKDLLKAK